MKPCSVKHACGLAFALLCLAPQVASPADLPSDFPEITVTVSDNPAPGYVFLSNFSFDAEVGNTPYLLILDNTGYPVAYEQLTAPFNLDFKLLPSGRLSYCNGLEFFILDESFAVVDNFQAGNGYHTDVHEYRLLPNGHAYILAWRTRTVDMTAYGGLPRAQVLDCAIQEVDNQGNVYWQWETAEHFEITDATPDIPLTTSLIDYAHCNAIEVDPDGNLLLSSRHFDEITKIDRQTGEIIWRMGGSYCKNNEFTFINDSFGATEDEEFDLAEGEQTRAEANGKPDPGAFYGFSHQHAVRLLENGHMTIFDNGNLRSPQRSRAVEYEIDEERRTVRKVWEYRNTPDVTSTEMGYAQRLENGNTLIGWGGNEDLVTVTEVRPDGSKAFEMHFADQVFSYRAFRFVYGMSAMSAPVDSPGEYRLTSADQPTGVTIEAEVVTGAGSLTVERHEYAPPRLDFLGSRPLGQVLRRRWVLRMPEQLEVSGIVRFEGPALEGIAGLRTAVVYRRPREGTGGFAPLATRYDPAVPALEADFSGPGELIIADGFGGALTGIRLEQNVPNPFGSSTAIRYSLPVEGPVRLTLYSASGRRLVRLIDAVEEPGEHEVVLDARSLASGTYFYRLESPAGTRVRKASVIRR